MLMLTISVEFAKCVAKPWYKIAAVNEDQTAHILHCGPQCHGMVFTWKQIACFASLSLHSRSVCTGYFFHKYDQVWRSRNITSANNLKYILMFTLMFILFLTILWISNWFLWGLLSCCGMLWHRDWSQVRPRQRYLPSRPFSKEAPSARRITPNMGVPQRGIPQMAGL